MCFIFKMIRKYNFFNYIKLFLINNSLKLLVFPNPENIKNLSFKLNSSLFFILKKELNILIFGFILFIDL